MVNNMNIEYIHINDLTGSEYNPRYMSDNDFNRAYNEMNSLAFEWVVNIVANRRKINDKWVLISGHQRHRIAKMLFKSGDKRFEKVPVQFVDVTLKEEKLLNLKLNKGFGRWDNDKLAEIDLSIPELTAIGFELDELSNRLDVELSTLAQLNTGKEIEKLNINIEEKPELIGYNIKIVEKDLKKAKSLIEYLKENGFQVKIKEIWE